MEISKKTSRSYRLSDDPSLMIALKLRTKRVITLLLILLVGIIVYVSFLMKFPWVSHHGYYVEKHLWYRPSYTHGKTANTVEYLEVFDRYDISNPTDCSIWIAAYERGHGWQPHTEVRLSSIPPPYVDRPEPRSSPRHHWHSWSLGCGQGVRVKEIEIPAGASWTFLLEARAHPHADDVKGVRIPFSTYSKSSHITLTRKITDYILKKLSLRSVIIPLQPILKKYPEVVDRVIDERPSLPGTTESKEPSKE